MKSQLGDMLTSLIGGEGNLTELNISKYYEKQEFTFSSVRSAVNSKNVV